jgi:hypothetical protein
LGQPSTQWERERPRLGAEWGNDEPPDADGVIDALDALTALGGIDIAVASGFFQFLGPARFVAIDPRTWRVLVAAGEFDDPYPEPPSVGDYRRFDDVCRAVMARTGVDAWTLYRALWRSVSELPDAKRGVGSNASP